MQSDCFAVKKQANAWGHAWLKMLRRLNVAPCLRMRRYVAHVSFFTLIRINATEACLRQIVPMYRRDR